MEKISGFFDKFRSKVISQVQNYVIFTEVIKKHTGIEIEMKDMSLSGGVLKIKTSSIIKNEIFIKKNRILKEIAEKIKKIRVNDIQ
jgi:hypothetical protein